MIQILSLLMVLSSSAFAQEEQSFIPPNCTVEDWCLVKATDCFVGEVEIANGAFYGHSRYSVVRRASVLCRDYYGQFDRRVITGPVEPVDFVTAACVFSDEARDEALNLCNVYRTDWVSAAPRCK